MQCDRARSLLGPYRDEELGADDRQAIEAHLAGCAACSDAHADEQRVARALRTFGRHEPPAGLAERIAADLDRAAHEAPASGVTAPVLSLPAALSRRHGFARAAAVLLACVISALGGWWAAGRPDHAEALVHDVLTAHVRSLLQDQPVQVVSTDQHTVRPWFAGRAEFAPPVKTFAAEGFELVGGRVDYVGGRRVAAIVYKRRLHVINVFMWPAQAPASGDQPRVVSRNGYNIIGLSRSGVAYWLVSDLNGDELRQLAGLL